MGQWWHDPLGFPRLCADSPWSRQAMGQGLWRDEERPTQILLSPGQWACFSRPSLTAGFFSLEVGTPSGVTRSQLGGHGNMQEQKKWKIPGLEPHQVKGEAAGGLLQAPGDGLPVLLRNCAETAVTSTSLQGNFLLSPTRILGHSAGRMLRGWAAGGQGGVCV